VMLRERFLEEAEKLSVQVMERSFKAFGVKHPDSLTSMGNLASPGKAEGGTAAGGADLEDKTEVFQISGNFWGVILLFTYIPLTQKSHTSSKTYIKPQCLPPSSTPPKLHNRPILQTCKRIPQLILRTPMPSKLQICIPLTNSHARRKSHIIKPQCPR
jgi:hypothetical protein